MSFASTINPISPSLVSHKELTTRWSTWSMRRSTSKMRSHSYERVEFRNYEVAWANKSPLITSEVNIFSFCSTQCDFVSGHAVREKLNAVYIDAWMKKTNHAVWTNANQWPNRWCSMLYSRMKQRHAVQTNERQNNSVSIGCAYPMIGGEISWVDHVDNAVHRHGRRRFDDERSWDIHQGLLSGCSDAQCRGTCISDGRRFQFDVRPVVIRWK